MSCKNRKTLIVLFISFFILTVIAGCSNLSSKNRQIGEKEEHLNSQTDKERDPSLPQVLPEIENDPTNESQDEKSKLLDTLEVHYLDVGQGDSILIKIPTGQNILIDAGNKDCGSVVVNYLQKQGVKKLNHVIGTHPHEDHIGGLIEVIKSFTIDNVYLPKVLHTTKIYKDLLIEIKAKGLRISEAKAGSELIKKKNINAFFIAPANKEYEEINNYSAVLKLIYGHNSFLFTGDAENKSEDEMLTSTGLQLNSNVLKVGHHGSSTSTSLAFLKAVNPKYAIISVGKDNDYEHPEEEILERLVTEGVHYFRTDEQGTIIAYSDGETIGFNQPGLATVEKKENEIKIAADNSPHRTFDPVPSNAEEIKITSIDLSREIVIIKNTGNSNVDLSGWKLVSIQGNQEFIFPSGIVLQPENTIKIISGPQAEVGTGNLVWTKKYIWNDDKDQGKLYNYNGKLISTLSR